MPVATVLREIASGRSIKQNMQLPLVATGAAKEIRQLNEGGEGFFHRCLRDHNVLERGGWETFKCTTRGKYLLVVHTTERRKTSIRRRDESHPVKCCGCWEFRERRPGLRASLRISLMFRACPPGIQAHGENVADLHLLILKDESSYGPWAFAVNTAG